MIVKSELEKLDIPYTVVDLGEVEVKESIPSEKLNQLNIALHKFGLELMDNKKSILIERIKGVIIELIHYSDEPLRINYSRFLSEKLNHDYTYLANLFSEVTGTTIEHFIIHHKIERVKELLVYNDTNLTEISYKLHYSSVAHLSNQFTKVTGLTPSHFKQMKHKRRKSLNDM
jgi:AraC-like DNA-binding protein